MKWAWASIVLVATATASSAGITEEMLELWTERANAYTSQLNDTKVRQDAALKDLQSDAPSADPKQKFVAVFDASNATGYMVGRWQTLERARTYFAKKRSAAAAEIWIQGQGESAQLDVAKARADLNAAPNQPESVPFTERVNFTLGAIYKAGIAQGQVDELALLDKNLGSYFAAKNSEDAQRREARAKFFNALGAAIREDANRNDMFHVSCRQSLMGNRVDCDGGSF